MNTFSLKVIATDKVFYDGKCTALIIPALDGEREILAHHENMVIATKEGEVRCRTDENSDWKKAVVGVGFVHIANNRVTMLVDTAERPDEIDAKRAKRDADAAKEALLAEKKEEKDYQVLDELPFYFNGAGYVNKHRTALFLFEEESGKLTRLTKESFDVSSAHLSPDGTQLLFTGESYTTKRKLRSGVYRYDFATGETAQLLAPRSYSLYDALWWGEKVLLLATDHKRYGMNENVQFYTLEPATGEISLLTPYEEAVGSSVGSDCRLGGGREWVAQDGKLYFVATIRNASQVFCLEENGDIRPVYTQEGSVDCIDVAGGTLYFIGMQDMKLQELYAWDEAAQERVQLTVFNEQALAGAYVALPEKLTFTNDGIDLDGWVLRPKDFDPQKAYPAILDIHGGPKTVYGEVFYHEMQYWASQGWFVFFCNPRGGDGRGNQFADLRGKYGTIDYSDIMAFTDKVLEKYPQIDAQKLCVTGGSYGGFGSSQRGEDLRAEISVSFDEAAFGCEKKISLQGQDGKISTVQVKIPAGIESGKTIRLRGKGMPGSNSAGDGDLLLKVTVQEKPGFERKGADLYTTVKIPFTTAVLGGEAEVATLTGKVVCRIKPGTQSGSRIRLKGKGIVSMKDASVHGDQYVTVQIDVPKNLSAAAKQKLREFEEACKGSRGAA